jgi:hypothetical protein
VVPLSALTAGNVTVEPELNLVLAMPGWAPGFSAKPVRQRHVYAIPRPGLPPLEVFSQEVWNN